MSKGKKILLYSTLTIVGLYFLFLSLVEAKAFLVPLVTAVILALLMVPLSKKMERGFMNRSWAAFVNTLILFIASLGFMALVSFQIKNVVDEWPQIKETMQPKLEQLRSWAINNTPLEDGDIPEVPEGSGSEARDRQSGSGESGTGGSQNREADSNQNREDQPANGQSQNDENQNESQQPSSEGDAASGGFKPEESGNQQGPGSQQGTGNQQGSGESSGLSSLMESGNTGQRAASFFSLVMSFFADYLLTFIYIFFLLTYRHRFKVFLLKLFPKDKKDDVKKVIEKSATVTQHYLVGKIILIGFLAVIYSIGLGISGVNNFILISVLAAFLSLIPYIGNIIGFGMALAFGYLTSGETGVLIGIMITFAIAQFIESYVLEPYIVGDQVDLHPFFVIIAVIIGGAVWGVAGMVLSIPVLAIINIIFLNIGPLNPFGYLLSKEDDD